MSIIVNQYTNYIQCDSVPSGGYIRNIIIPFRKA